MDTNTIQKSGPSADKARVSVCNDAKALIQRHRDAKFHVDTPALGSAMCDFIIAALDAYATPPAGARDAVTDEMVETALSIYYQNQPLAIPEVHNLMRAALEAALTGKADGGDKWNEWLKHAIAKWPDAENALIATASAMGPQATLNADDFKWAEAQAAQPAATGAGEGSRFFIEHGIVHDRKTGKHLRGTDEYGDKAADLLAVLQELEGRSLLKITRAALRRQIAADVSGEPEAFSAIQETNTAATGMGEGS